jgi:hypothetical protein
LANTGDSRKIQKMLKEGTIGAEEGRRGPASSSNLGRGSGAGRMLSIRVTDIATGRSKASVQIPVGLVDAGMKIGAQFAPHVEGVDMAKVLDAIRAGATGKILDVTDDQGGEHVEISVE